MIKILDNFPDDVLAMECIGKVTADDYRDGLIPEVTARLKKHKSLRALCLIGEGFKGYAPGAAWSDFTFGVSHWNQFSRMPDEGALSNIRRAGALPGQALIGGIWRQSSNT
ncbi:hypothetical protein PEL8287_01456 [Roseovarius litorisediminis]|uniref:Uncharacterized protein n=1 Tax=Roseovarius litorisediminis TaxID=1312363 RepID=A0A1Y5S338_9RHOB|nr:STAS/SEC14 domain-containing protein [Roseovarius litorisediminis]SLN31220.1 hypothetical protein PEL8287_01456 [Roseovarius litorisediminis]